MSSKRKIKKIIKKIIAYVSGYDEDDIKMYDHLRVDLDIKKKHHFKDIRDAINYEYGLSLKKWEIKTCFYVRDIVDLVYQELEENNFSEDERRFQEQWGREDFYSRQSAVQSKESFLEWLAKAGLGQIVKKIAAWTFETIGVMFGIFL